MRTRYPDRAAAGAALSRAVADAVGDAPAVVLGVPNGGVAVAAPIAAALSCPLGAVWIGKLASPREPDVRLGAIDLDGDVTLNVEAVSAEGMDGEAVTELAYHARGELRRKAGAVPDLEGKTVVIVDDGLTTGVTLIAALRWARRRGAGRLVVAVPVVDARIWTHVAAGADEAVALEVRSDGPIARSEIYDAYELLDRATARRLLRGPRRRRAARSTSPSPGARPR
jgi:predicted phosphoribosyltransferase